MKRLALVLVVACSSNETTMTPLQPCGTQTGTGCAPDSARVDLGTPTFSQPMQFDNPLHPLPESVLLLGTDGGEPLRVEVTLLPNPKSISWNGGIQAAESQYLAYIDGRIAEVALDWFAQDDGGAVWYLGEDVFNYDDGVVEDTEGTWQAGRDGPGGMIMGASPAVGNVWRPENSPPIVFEEVTVMQTGVTVDGPRGPVTGAIVVRELHLEGDTEDKTFAPGYGEFSTIDGADLEAVALAVPTDALGTPVPAALDDLATAANAHDARAAWDAFRAAGPVPPRLATQTEDAVSKLEDAGDADERAEATLEVHMAALDLELRHRPVVEIDEGRFGLWTERLVLDADAGEGGDVRGDVATLERIRDRFAHTLADRATLDAKLAELRTAADAGKLTTAGRIAAELGDLAATW